MKAMSPNIRIIEKWFRAFGHSNNTIWVPSWALWVISDPDGNIYASESRPKKITDLPFNGVGYSIKKPYCIIEDESSKVPHSPRRLHPFFDVDEMP